MNALTLFLFCAYVFVILAAWIELPGSLNELNVIILSLLRFLLRRVSDGAYTCADSQPTFCVGIEMVRIKPIEFISEAFKFPA